MVNKSLMNYLKYYGRALGRQQEQNMSWFPGDSQSRAQWLSEEVYASFEYIYHLFKPLSIVLLKSMLKTFFISKIKISISNSSQTVEHFENGSL